MRGGWVSARTRPIAAGRKDARSVQGGGAGRGGAVVIEVVLQRPGVGRLLAPTIRAQQFVAVQSIVAILAIGYVGVNTLIDLLYVKLDPRVRSVSSVG